MRSWFATARRDVVGLLVVVPALSFLFAITMIVTAVLRSPTYRRPASLDPREACPAGFHVTLPTEGYRLADGTFVERRRAVPGPDGTLLFNDRAGRARCLRPLG